MRCALACTSRWSWRCAPLPCSRRWRPARRPRQPTPPEWAEVIARPSPSTLKTPRFAFATPPRRGRRPRTSSPGPSRASATTSADGARPRLARRHRGAPGLRPRGVRGPGLGGTAAELGRGAGLAERERGAGGGALAGRRATGSRRCGTSWCTSRWGAGRPAGRAGSRRASRSSSPASGSYQLTQYTTLARAVASRTGSSTSTTSPQGFPERPRATWRSPTPRALAFVEFLHDRHGARGLRRADGSTSAGASASSWRSAAPSTPPLGRGEGPSTTSCPRRYPWWPTLRQRDDAVVAHRRAGGAGVGARRREISRAGTCAQEADERREDAAFALLASLSKPANDDVAARTRAGARVAVAGDDHARAVSPSKPLVAPPRPPAPSARDGCRSRWRWPRSARRCVADRPAAPRSTCASKSRCRQRPPRCTGTRAGPSAPPPAPPRPPGGGSRARR